MIYYLTKPGDVLQSNFWVILKIAFAKLWKPIHDIIKYSTLFVLLSLKSVKKQAKNYKIWISQGRKKLFGWNKKNIFYSVWGMPEKAGPKIWDPLRGPGTWDSNIWDPGSGTLKVRPGKKDPKIMKWDPGHRTSDVGH